MSAPKAQNGFVCERIVSLPAPDETIKQKKFACDFKQIDEIRRDQALSPAGENRYPPPLMVRITAGRVGSGSILRRIRMIRRSTARSKASLSRALASSSSRSRDSTRFGFAANTF